MAEGQGSAATTRGVHVRSYSTRFERDEEPLSEDGVWDNGKRDGIDWADVLTKSGVAFGAPTRMAIAERRVEQGNLLTDGEESASPEGDYDDPTAILRGTWGRNQYAKATVFSRNQTDDYFQEVELRLRSTIETHRCTGYEVFFRCLKTDAGYAEIARWNGGVAEFTSLKKLIGSEYGVENGDMIEASVVGNVITGFINGHEVISVTDDMFTSGNPGIGFNFGVGDTNVDHGLSSFEVATYD